MSSRYQGDVHAGLGQRPGYQTVTSFFPQKHTCLTTVYAAHVPLGCQCLNVRKRDNITILKRKYHSIAVDTSTREVACAFASQPQLLLCAHSPVLSHGHKPKHPQNRSAPEFVGSALLALLLPLRQRLVVCVSVRSPFMPSTSTPSHPAGGSSQSSPSAWQPPHSPSLGRVAHDRSCGPLSQLSGVNEISGHVILQLQSTNDLASLKCMAAEMAKLARSEHKTSGSALVRIFIIWTIQGKMGAAG